MSCVFASVHFFGARNPLIDRLAACETLIGSMPMSDAFLSELPAQKDNLTVHFAGKVEESYVEILHLHPDGIDLGNRIFYALFRLRPFALATD